MTERELHYIMNWLNCSLSQKIFIKTDKVLSPPFQASLSYDYVLYLCAPPSVLPVPFSHKCQLDHVRMQL